MTMRTRSSGQKVISTHKHNPEFDRVTRKKARMLENKGDPKSEDYISRLPDDLLILILSFLPLKDAIATSFLSRRWRYTWTCTRGMYIEDESALDKIADEPSLLRAERTKYVNWVNLVLRKHRSVTMDSFRICFDLDNSSKSAIDRWIKFAILKRVRMLQVDLSESVEDSRLPFYNYTFTQKLLAQLKESLKIFCSNIPTMEPSTHLGITSLTDLHLASIFISEKTLKDMLLCCPALQLLSLHRVTGLVGIKISGQSLKLRTLKIILCEDTSNIEICDTKLVSFAYLGLGINVVLKDVPMLKKVSIGQGLSGLVNFRKTLRNCFHQIQVLRLDMYNPQESIGFKFPKMRNVKQLRLEIGALDDTCLLHLTSLVKACSLLETFKLQLTWISPAKRRRKIREAAKFPHKHLRLVKISGYYGRTSDAELALYFIQNAVQLKKMVIDPSNRKECRRVDQVMLKKEEAARNHAKQHIAPTVPDGVDLVIL